MSAAVARWASSATISAVRARLATVAKAVSWVTGEGAGAADRGAGAALADGDGRLERGGEVEKPSATMAFMTAVRSPEAAGRAEGWARSATGCKFWAWFSWAFATMAAWVVGDTLREIIPLFAWATAR